MVAKPRTPRAKAAKAAPEAETAETTEGEGAKKGALRIKELVDRAAAKTTDVKKKDLRTAAEVILAEIGLALAEGEALSLPGLGHLRVGRKGENGSATLKLRAANAEGGKKKGKKAEEGASEALAEAGEAE